MRANPDWETCPACARCFGLADGVFAAGGRAFAFGSGGLWGGGGGGGVCSGGGGGVAHEEWVVFLVVGGGGEVIEFWLEKGEE